MYPWKIHYVKDETLRDGMCDAHTHGLDAFGSLEIQFVLDYPTEAIAYLLNEVGEAIRRGLILEDGIEIEGLCDDGAIIKVYETVDDLGDAIFRLIMPDKEFRYPEDSDEYPYNMQYDSPYLSMLN